MKKIIEICIGALIVIVIIMIIVFKVFFAASTSTPAPTNTNNINVTSPNTTSGQPASGNTFTVAIVGGGTIQTKNFKEDPATGQYPTPGYYYIGPHAPVSGVTDATATDNPPFIILFIDSTQYFNIELLQAPVGAARTQAEQYLMSKLGISQTQMCELKYMVSVPSSVDQTYAGISLGFSFCPGAVVLP